MLIIQFFVLQGTIFYVQIKSIVANQFLIIRVQYQLVIALQLNMEETIEKMKIDRSRLKAKLTSLAKQMSSTSKAQSAKLFDELQVVYNDLLTTHFLYCELVESGDYTK